MFASSQITRSRGFFISIRDLIDLNHWFWSSCNFKITSFQTKPDVHKDIPSGNHIEKADPSSACRHTAMTMLQHWRTSRSLWLIFSNLVLERNHTTIWIWRLFVCPETPPPFMDRSAPILAGRLGYLDSWKGYIPFSLCRQESAGNPIGSALVVIKWEDVPLYSLDEIWLI